MLSGSPAQAHADAVTGHARAPWPGEPRLRLPVAHAPRDPRPGEGHVHRALVGPGRVGAVQRVVPGLQLVQVAGAVAVAVEALCNGLQCGLTEVSIPGFDQAPYNADGNHMLRDAAWRPGCDGGVIVGGYTNFNTDLGHIIHFQVVNGRACR